MIIFNVHLTAKKLILSIILLSLSFVSVAVPLDIGLWTNTDGRIRDITEAEKSSTSINAVGRLICEKSNGERFAGTATVTERRKGTDAVILFSGHSLCEGGELGTEETCVFEHEYRGGDSEKYGRVYEYKLKNLNSLYNCSDPRQVNDLAAATLENFDGALDSAIFLTSSINKKRRVGKNGEITYDSNSPDKYTDGEMLLVGYDRIHNKLMVSENCGLFDDSEQEALYPNEKGLMTHDCKHTPGYSGGPIFKKSYNHKLKKNTYGIVCVNLGDTTYEKPSSRNYRKLVKGITGGNCRSMEKEVVRSLYKSIGAF